MRPALRANAPAFALAALAALGAKAAHARLGPDQLFFMAGPTQALVGALSGIDFTHEAGYGYVSLAHRIVLAKSCLGVNYLVAVFGLLVATVIPAVTGGRRKVLALFPLAGAAWAATIAVNSLRIAVGISLHDLGLARGWLTPDRVHRAAGIAVYFPALVGIQALAARVTGAVVAGPWRGPVVGPFLWYALVALGLPLANGALRRQPHLFLEHGAWVLGAALFLALVMTACRRLLVEPPGSASGPPS